MSHRKKEEPETGENGPESDIQSESRAEYEALKAKADETAAELADFKDKYLRALADGENARKRIRQQCDESIKIQREDLLRDLLTIIDNLERAVDAARGGGNGKSIVEGVEMVLNSMKDFLRSHGVSEVSTVGRPFDPLLHEAVDHVASAEHEPNTVINEFNRGYKVGDRLLRPARVSVAKAVPEGQETKDPDDQDEL
ncbi:MAG TPA: nucleotide exchange factor GrpE [Candidatus Binataceae bacterium]